MLERPPTVPDPRDRTSQRLTKHTALRELQRRLFGRPAEPLRLGRYLLREPLGEGGFGLVYRAHDPALQRDVAIKVLRGGEVDPEQAAELAEESRTIAALDHPNIVRVFDVGTAQTEVLGGESGTAIYMVLELIEGRTLRQWVAEEEPDTERIHSVLEQAGRGVAAVHAANMAHGDLKPSNVLVDGAGTARVVDFGLAQHVGRLRETDDPSGPSSESGTWVLAGTPRYMAPETHLGAPPTHASDQYSFALLSAELLARAYPFPRTWQGLIAAKDRGLSSGWLQAHGVAPAIAAILTRALEPRPDDRYPSMDALLDAWFRGGRRWGWAAAGLAAVGLMFAVGLASDAEDPCRSFTASAQATVDELGASIDERFDSWDATYAPALHERVRQRIDGLVLSWSAQAESTCEAPRADAGATANRSELCLRDRLDEFRAALRVLGDASPRELERSMGVLSTVGDPALCAAENAESPMLSADPRLQSEAATLRRELVDARAQIAAGRFEEVRARTQDVLERAEELELAAVVAEARYEHANAIASLGNAREATASLERAYLDAMALGHERLAGSAAVRVAIVNARQVEDPEAAAKWIEWAQASVARLEHPGDTDAALHYANGVLAHRRGKVAEAARHYEAARERFVALADQDGVASTLNALAVIRRHEGKNEEALALLREALEMEEARVGPGHPATSVLRSNLGLARLGLGHLDAAERTLRRVVEDRRAALGPDHPDLAKDLINLSNAVYSGGRLEDAIAYQRRAVAILEKSVGAHPTLAIALDNIGTMLTEVGRPEEALALHERALEIQRARLPPTHEMIANTLANLGHALADLERFDEADARLREAMEIAQAAEAPAAIRIPSILAYQGLAAQGRGDDGRAQLRRAIEGLEALPPSVLLGDALFSLARAEAQSASDAGDEPSRALEHARRAQTVFDAVSSEARRRSVDDWLAKHDSAARP